MEFFRGKALSKTTWNASRVVIAWNCNKQEAQAGVQGQPRLHEYLFQRKKKKSPKKTTSVHSLEVRVKTLL